MCQRTIVYPLIQNESHYLLCKMVTDRGVFPGQQALPGGDVEPVECIEETLRREIREELGEKLILTHIAPWSFHDDTRVKTYPDGRQKTIYTIYLIFDCVSTDRSVTTNEEFDDYAWVKAEDLKNYGLNATARITLSQKGLLQSNIPRSTHPALCRGIWRVVTIRSHTSTVWPIHAAPDGKS